MFGFPDFKTSLTLESAAVWRPVSVEVALRFGRHIHWGNTVITKFSAPNLASLLLLNLHVCYEQLRNLSSIGDLTTRSGRSRKCSLCL
jgi:hypothetical protein